MARLLEPLAWLALAVMVHLLLAAVVIRPSGETGERATSGPLVMGSDQTAALIAAWEAPPAAAPEPAAMAPAPELAAPLPKMPAPTPQPRMRPVLSHQLTLPDAAPRIASALLLRQSARPEARPARRAAPVVRRDEPAAPAARQPAPKAAPQGNGAPSKASPPSGQSGGGQARPANNVNTAALMGEWAAQISGCIGRNARAPAGGGRGGGRVLLNLQIGRNGVIQGVGIAASSGNPALDQAAVDGARRAGRCPAAPRGLDQPGFSFQLPVNPAR